jgi:hypothetical protein
MDTETPMNGYPTLTLTVIAKVDLVSDEVVTRANGRRARRMSWRSRRIVQRQAEPLRLGA